MAFWSFLQPKNELESGGRTVLPVQEDASEPEKVCPNCHKPITISRLWANKNVCKCGYHFRMTSRQRIAMIADEGTFEEMFGDVKAKDLIKFPGYAKKLKTTQQLSNEEEGVVCGVCEIFGQKSAIFVMESFFMMGSMGTAVGERITKTFEYATEHELPVIGFTVSGGARMQEGMFSLMQMAKTSGAVKRHSDAGLLYLTVITDPTTGGVTASFAMEGDIIIAEPGATVGFAGKRVIEQTILKALPKGFQTAEFLLEHGFIDAIVTRPAQKRFIAKMLKIHNGGWLEEMKADEAAASEVTESDEEPEGSETEVGGEEE